MAHTPSVDSQDNAKNDPEDGLTKRHAFVIATMMMFAMLTFLIAFTVIGYSIFKYRYINDGPLENETVFEINRGAGLSTIAANLEAQGVISRKNIFKIFVKFDGGETSLKAGEYAIPAQASMQDVYEILQNGQAILYPFTVAEGLTSAQILRQISKYEGLGGIVPAKVAEGTLLPETYMLPKTMSKVELIAKMRQAQTKALDELWEGRAKGLPIKTKQDALILASIVEKETGQTSERERVAGVFINRLNKGMRLESDPTIIYGISGGEKLGRGLRRSEIDRKTDWNTYQIDGLPITAICNPGRAAIAAVLNPARTKDIFFVADGTGGHVFATNLRDHINNVNKWRKIERARKKARKAANKKANP
ncbi:MAG: aminodeoxychorismate lyase [Robiginitomaculum sp.]|nr:MAG: aminodeoxychorismate lyase [Robiginitomaculum sp.]